MSSFHVSQTIFTTPTVDRTKILMQEDGTGIACGRQGGVCKPRCSRNAWHFIPTYHHFPSFEQVFISLSPLSLLLVITCMQYYSICPSRLITVTVTVFWCGSASRDFCESNFISMYPCVWHAASKTLRGNYSGSKFKVELLWLGK